MKISQQSWHYRFLDKLECNIPDDLCTYFWKVVFFMVCIVAAAVMAVVAAVSMLSPILALFLDYEFLEQIKYAGAFIDVLILVIVWLVYRDATKHNRQPSLVGEWISAKKRGICPLIEFV